jgi:hypothetical protein
VNGVPKVRDGNRELEIIETLYVRYLKRIGPSFMFLISKKTYDY